MVKTMYQDPYPGHAVFCSTHKPIDSRPIEVEDITNCWACVRIAKGIPA